MNIAILPSFRFYQKWCGSADELSWWETTLHSTYLNFSNSLFISESIHTPLFLFILFVIPISQLNSLSPFKSFQSLCSYATKISIDVNIPSLLNEETESRTRPIIFKHIYDMWNNTKINCFEKACSKCSKLKNSPNTIQKKLKCW